VDRIEPIRPRPTATPQIPAIRRTERTGDEPERERQDSQQRRERREPPPRQPPPDDGRPHIDVTV
jgi:hypothetical protein